VARKGEEVGVPAPANGLVTSLVLAKQATRSVRRSASPSRRTEA
jgi:ketopantoate reductase